MFTNIIHKQLNNGYSKTIFFKKNNIIVYIFDSCGRCVAKHRIRKEGQNDKTMQKM